MNVSIVLGDLSRIFSAKVNISLTQADRTAPVCVPFHNCQGVAPQVVYRIGFVEAHQRGRRYSPRLAPFYDFALMPHPSRHIAPPRKSGR
jgi:hypothetical protein